MSELNIPELLENLRLGMQIVKPLCWDGDNRIFVVEVACKVLPLDPDVKQLIRWAYGYDGGWDGKCKEQGQGASYEKASNGSTVVADCTMFGKYAKDPAGVSHDMLFHLKHMGMADPSGHSWRLHESNEIYQRGIAQFGYPTRGMLRIKGLALASWYPWYFGGNKEHGTRIN